MAATHKELIDLVSRFRIDKEAAGAVNIPPEDAPPPAPPPATPPASRPPPASGSPEEIAAKKKQFTDDQIKKVQAGAAPSVSDDAESFPHWHVDAKVLLDAEERKYPRRLDASRKTNYRPPPPPEPSRTTYGYSDPNDPINTPGAIPTDFAVKPGPVRTTTVYMNDDELAEWVEWLRVNEPDLYMKYEWDLLNRTFHNFLDTWETYKDKLDKALADAAAAAAAEDAKKKWPPDWEFSEEELTNRGLKSIFQRQWLYYVARGWVTPYIQRMKPDDEIVTKIKAARAMLPKVEFGKGKRMQWLKVGNTGGWMYTTDPKDPYITWLFGQWAQPWLDASNKAPGTVTMQAAMAAMATMFQEAHPSSINTYDGCVFSWGVGFAIGAPQIVGEVIKNPTVRKILYLTGIHVTPGPELNGTCQSYDIQIVDFTDDGKPLVQVWDSRHHWYGFDQIGPLTVAPSNKGGQKADYTDTFQVDTDNAAVAKQVGDPQKSTIGDQPISNSELPWHAYQHLSNQAGKDMEVLSAFIALAEDELTRGIINNANQSRITRRATINDPNCRMYTEAGYTFLSMCVHNWALPATKPNAKADGAAALYLGTLIPASASTPYLSEADARAVRAIRGFLGPRPAASVSAITFGKAPGDAANMSKWPDGDMLTDAIRDGVVATGAPGTDVTAWWLAAEVHDALVAKALARFVMSLLEWNRWTTGVKQWVRDNAKGKPGGPVGMNDEQVRSYNWGWRFKRLQSYWLRMWNGRNYFGPLVSVVKGSGIDVNAKDGTGALVYPNADALIAAHGVRYMKFPDFDISEPKSIMKIPDDHYAAIRGDEWGDGVGKTPVDFYDLGPLVYFNLPALMKQYGRRFEITYATVDGYNNAKTAKVRLLQNSQMLDVDRLGMTGSVAPGPTLEPQPEWPAETPAPNFMTPGGGTIE